MKTVHVLLLAALAGCVTHHPDDIDCDLFNSPLAPDEVSSFGFSGNELLGDFQTNFSRWEVGWTDFEPDILRFEILEIFEIYEVSTSEGCPYEDYPTLTVVFDSTITAEDGDLVSNGETSLSADALGQPTVGFTHAVSELGDTFQASLDEGLLEHPDGVVLFQLDPAKLRLKVEPIDEHEGWSFAWCGLDAGSCTISMGPP